MKHTHRSFLKLTTHTHTHTHTQAQLTQRNTPSRSHRQTRKSELAGPSEARRKTREGRQLARGQQRASGSVGVIFQRTAPSPARRPPTSACNKGSHACQHPQMGTRTRAQGHTCRQAHSHKNTNLLPLFQAARWGEIWTASSGLGLACPPHPLPPTPCTLAVPASCPNGGPRVPPGWHACHTNASHVNVYMCGLQRGGHICKRSCTGAPQCGSTSTCAWRHRSAHTCVHAPGKTEKFII